MKRHGTLVLLVGALYMRQVAPVLDDGVLVPRVHMFFPDSVQPSVPLSNE